MAGLRLAVFVVGTTLMACVGQADATGYDTATRAALQRVVTQQLDALRRGDGVAAEAFAAPGIRSKFPDPSKFLDMVKTHYAALIEPRHLDFVAVEDSPHGPLQKVTVVAADGTVWTAVYSFEKVGEEWRITGCGLEEDRNQQAI